MESSGFFQAVWDDTLMNPITKEYTGWWDRDYLAKSFADFFALFIGNGVFISPTNQLKVIQGTGMTVTVSAGWAIINGTWYHNDAPLTLPIATNGTSTARIDSIRVRYMDSNRISNALVFTGNTELTRGETIYDLELAQVQVGPYAVEITDANITDRRGDASVCGFVKGLMDVVDTEDLFAQFTAMFNEWFDTVKGQLTGDLGARLQLEFTELNTNVEQYQTNVQQQIAGYNENYQQTLDSAETLVEDFVYNDYVIPEQTLTFTNKVCTISDSKVKASSLLDVYFTADTIAEAEECKIVVDSGNGTITLTAEKQPQSNIKAMIRVRVLDNEG